MEKQDCLEIGRISKTVGYKGSVILSVLEGSAQSIEKEGSVFIEINEELVPFFIDEIQDTSEDAVILKFEEFSDVETARTFTGRRVFLPIAILPGHLRESLMDNNIEGYTVVDERLGDIGTAAGILALPGHSVLKVRQGKREILIPWVREIIVATEHHDKIIRLRTPEGLIEAYLK